MSGNLFGFDASIVPEQMDYAALPEGDYTVIITASEMKPTKSGDGKYLQLQLDIIDGQFSGRKIFDNLNLYNPNQIAVDIAQRRLAAICRAVGVLKPSDSSELHNKPLKVSIEVELSENPKTGKKTEQNRVKRYDPATAAATGYAPQPTAAAPAPAQSAPAAAEQKAPWLK